MMTRLNYSQAEIEEEHDYASPHIECGQKLHGGFSVDGKYVSPRTKNRWTAINTWHEQLNQRKVPIVEATTNLLTEPNFPNEQQQILLLKNGINQSFWDSLTITGIIEGRGRALADVAAPDFQEIIVEDISCTALEHMNKGLLRAHGWDEGGNPDSDLGGHDVMWYAVRDLIFGKDLYPSPQAPERIGREKDEREMEQLPEAHEFLLSFLMNLLMIEVRAERAFSFYESVISDASVFTDRRQEAAHAVDLIDRVRQDEAVHVAWLRAAISEFRSFTINTVDGATVPGSKIVDPVWEKMVHWHAIEMHEATRETNRAELEKKILAVADGQKILKEFLKLAV